MEKPLRDLFRRTREDRGLKQDQVAAAGGVSQGLVSRIENDPGYQPSVSVFLRAVRGLGIPFSVFFAAMEGGSQSSALTPAARGVQSEASAPPASAPHGDHVSAPSLDDDLIERFARAFITEARKQERRAESREHAAGDRPARPGRRPATRKVR